MAEVVNLYINNVVTVFLTLFFLTFVPHFCRKGGDYKERERCILMTTFVFRITYGVSEFIFGLLFNILVLQIDGLHMIVDSSGLLFTLLLAFWLKRKGNIKKSVFTSWKADPHFVTVVLSVMLIVVGIMNVFEGIKGFLDGQDHSSSQETLSPIVLVIASGAITMNAIECMLYVVFLNYTDKRSVLIWHSFSDCFISLLATITSIVGNFVPRSTLQNVDCCLSICSSAILIFYGVRKLISNKKYLLDERINQKDLKELRELVKTLDNSISVKRCWYVSQVDDKDLIAIIVKGNDNSKIFKRGLRDSINKDKIRFVARRRMIWVDGY